MIEQLGYYLRANGTICKIEEIGDTDLQDNCYDDVRRSYFPNGRYYQDEKSDRDIIAYIPPELQFEILRVIEAYHTTASFNSMINNCYKNHLEKKGE